MNVSSTIVKRRQRRSPSRILQSMSRKRKQTKIYDNSQPIAIKKKPPTPTPSVTPPATQNAPAATRPDSEDQSYLHAAILPLLRSKNRNDLSKFCWNVLAKQTGLSPQSRAAKSLKQAPETAKNRTRLAEWLRDPAQLAATHAASVVATMVVGRERIRTGS